ncbi:DUF996 domain-containing protein [Thermococcus sp.]
MVAVKVDVSSEKNLGFWGLLLSLIGAFIPYIGSVLVLVGFILVLISLKGIGDKLGDDRPFKYYLYGFVFSVAGLLIAVILIFGFLGLVSFHSTSEFHSGMVGSEEITPGQNVVIHENLGGLSSPGIVFIGAVIVVILVMVAIDAYFKSKAWKAMYELTSVKEFDDASTWMRWGAFTAIMVVGLLLIFIGRIFAILAFNKMPEILGEDEPVATPEEVVW